MLKFQCTLLICLILVADVGKQVHCAEDPDYANTYFDKEGDTTTSCKEDGWDPSPCFVQHQPYYGVICERISDAQVLKDAFGRLKNQKCFPSLSLRDSTLKSLPSGVFGNIKFSGFELRNNALETIAPDVFEGMKDYLFALGLVGNRLKTIDFIPEAKHLGSIWILNEQCEQLADYAFAKLPKLEKIHIYDCPLRTIGKYAFANTAGLKNIGNCSIDAIDDHAFANSSGTIDIYYNEATIKKVGDYVFENFAGKVKFSYVPFSETGLSPKTFMNAKIKSIDFAGSTFTTLKEEIFSPLTHTKVWITGELTCDESMDWIQKNETIKKRFLYHCKGETKIVQ